MDTDYLGWTQGGNESNVQVEIVFDYLCPGSKKKTYDIVTTMSPYIDDIELRLLPFPTPMHKRSS